VSRSHFRLHEIFDALWKLLGPILAFTADEAWRYSSPGGSIHLQEFDPDP
jgi:isoleucyl-tRNA synthetase